MNRSEFLYKKFIQHFDYQPTPCQDRMFKELGDFLCCDDADILVINGYAGTGKTSAIASVIETLSSMEINSLLMAPTGRSAKVLSLMAGRPATTIHKSIYRQKSVSASGSNFSLAPNKAKNTLFVVDEVSLIGTDSLENSKGSAIFGSGNLLDDLVSFLRNGLDCRMILLGDDAQLPPVGLEESPALSQNVMQMYGGVCFCSLTTVVRQAEKSGVLHNATSLRLSMQEMRESGTIQQIALDLDSCEDIARVSGGDLVEILSDAYDNYGSEQCVVLCRSNKRANVYNEQIRSRIQYKEEELLKGDRLMIVRNSYQFVENEKELDYIANGDIAKLLKISNFEERYGLRFADAVLGFPDYGDVNINAKLCLDTLHSESASLSREQSLRLYEGVWEDYADRGSKQRIWKAVREDPYYNALQIKYAEAITCHKAQGGQWDCVFIDCPFWQEEQSVDDFRWLYTALTRAVSKVFLINFPDKFFSGV